MHRQITNICSTWCPMYFVQGCKDRTINQPIVKFRLSKICCTARINRTRNHDHPC